MYKIMDKSLQKFCYWHVKQNVATLTLGSRPMQGLLAKVTSQEWSSGITFHAAMNMGECEGMNLHTPKWAPTLGIKVPMDFQIFKER